MTDGVASFAAGIAGVAFDGMDNTTLAPFHDAHMVGVSVAVPVEENQHTGCRLDAVVRPLAPFTEPLDAVGAAGEFRNDA